MRIGIILVTHPGIGDAMLTQARVILDKPLNEVELIEVERKDSESRLQLDAALDRLGRDQGALILTDLPCASPANLALECASPASRVISGLNLPMLIRVCNYQDQPMEKLVEIAIEGAVRSAVVLS